MDNVSLAKLGVKIFRHCFGEFHRGEGTAEDLDSIRLQCGHVTDQTRCFLSHEENILMNSILDTFLDEFEAHLGKPCTAPHRAFLGKINYFDEETKEFEYAPYTF